MKNPPVWEEVELYDRVYNNVFTKIEIKNLVGQWWIAQKR